jgi:Uma2 family endonuclease
LNSKIIQKPMPKRKHSIIQGELTTAINQVAEPQKLAFASPELCCSFGDRFFYWDGQAGGAIPSL